MLASKENAERAYSQLRELSELIQRVYPEAAETARSLGEFLEAAARKLPREESYDKDSKRKKKGKKKHKV